MTGLSRPLQRIFQQAVAAPAFGESCIRRMDPVTDWRVTTRRARTIPRGEKRAQQLMVRDAIADVVDEVRANLRELEYTDSVTRERRERLLEVALGIDTRRAFFEQLASFPGYYTADLSVSAWERATRGATAAHIPPEFYSDAFPVYRGTELLMSLEGRIQDLIFGPLVYEPSSARVALRIADAIREQQAIWIGSYRPEFEAFLDEWGGMASGPVGPDRPP